MNHETVELAFVGVAALALFVQTIILVAIYAGISKATKSLKQEVDEIKASVMPTAEKTRDLVEKTRLLVDRLTPKVESTVTDFSELAHLLRVQASDVEVAVEQILDRVRRQTSRLDEMFTGTLDAVDKASSFVTKTVSKPVRQVSGILASAKAIFESLRSSDTSYRDRAMHDDKDLFV